MRGTDSIRGTVWVSSLGILLAAFVLVGVDLERRRDLDRERAATIDELEELKTREASLRKILEQVGRTRTPVVCECSSSTTPVVRGTKDATNAAPAEKVAKEEPPENPHAASEAALLIDRATAAGQWNGDDAANLRAQLAEMNSAVRQETVSRLIQLINNGTLKVDLKGPPF